MRFKITYLLKTAQVPAKKINLNNNQKLPNGNLLKLYILSCQDMIRPRFIIAIVFIEKYTFIFIIAIDVVHRIFIITFIYLINEI